MAKTRQNKKRTGTKPGRAAKAPARKPSKVVAPERRANPKRRLTANEIRRLVTKHVTKPWPVNVCRELAFQTLEGQRVAEEISPLRDIRKDLKAQAAAQHAQRAMVVAEELRAGRGKDDEPFTAKASGEVANAELEAKRLELKTAEVESQLKELKAKRRGAERTASKTVIDAWTGPSLFDPPEEPKPAADPEAEKPEA